ncbi:WAT1-related protein At4g08300-like [Humulus lupulus]|uniref:WAT1-related protein At4g08300-like n=1 Tax=Humulus lupulus TaxID=3486 RepID=UPI002B4070FD|nr:WAT1-related protein At4g08300-like [Humulus lupulus]
MGDNSIIGSQGGKISEALTKTKPYLAMVSLQFGYAGMYIISMVSFKHGMSHFVLSVYRHVVAFAIIAPFAFVLERKIRPKMTLPVFLRIVLLGFLEPVFDQNLYNLGMKYTSATFGSAIVNILPAITFIMALAFRLETVNVRKWHSLAKVIGTVITVSGAMVMTLYKGPILDIIHSSHDHSGQKSSTAESSDHHWVTGTLMLVGSCGGWASFFILQSFTLKKYPAELSLTAWICLMGVLEGGIVTFVFEHDMHVWVLGWDSRLLAAVYSGVVCSGMAYYVQGMVIRERGPVFVTSFSPLCMIITFALGAIVLAEQVHLGSIIGAIFIVIGLYTVVWGKSKDPIESSAPSKNIDQLPVTDTIKPISVVSVTSNNGGRPLEMSKISTSSHLSS